MKIDILNRMMLALVISTMSLVGEHDRGSVSPES